jgi:hypothetical protein
LGFSPNAVRLIKSRRIRWLEYVTLTQGKKYPYNFGRKSRRKESLARSRHRWENNNKMDVKEKSMGECGPDSYVSMDQ